MNRLRTIGLGALGALLGISIACSSRAPLLIPDSASSDDPQVEQRFRAARDEFALGNLEEADRGFAALIADHPEDPLARVAAIYRGRIALARDDPAAARELLQPVAGGDDPVGERAAFYDGIALHRLGRHGDALEQLTPFAGRLTDPGENLALLDTLWRAARAEGRAEEAVRWLDSYLGHVEAAEARDQAAMVLDEIIARLDDPAVLVALAGTLEPEQIAWPLVMARAAKLEFDAGRLEEASELLEEIAANKRGDEPAVVDVATTVERRSSVDLEAVGCIVPLSGRSRLVGEEVVKGVMLGARTLPTEDESAISVTIRDSGGDPERARKAVEDLVMNERVAAIVGPLKGPAAAAAAEAAEKLGVPLLALSIQADLTRDRAFVFRPFATNLAEVRGLLGAAQADGATRIAVLYPDNGYGRNMRALLSKEIAREGIELSGEVKYDPKKTSFVDTAEEVAALDFDALFVPDTAARVALVAPALASAGVWSARPGSELPGEGRAVRLLIPSVGFSPDLPRRAGRYLQGALFASFLADGSSHGAVQFFERFRDEYSAEPSYLSGFGHDAVVLAAAAVRVGAKSREDIREWLKGSADIRQGLLPLAAPFAGFDDHGEPLALPLVLELIEERVEVRR